MSPGIVVPSEQPPKNDSQQSDTPSGVTSRDGLTGKEAAARLRQYGPNSVQDKPIPLWKQLGKRFWGPVPWMLETVIAIQLGLNRGIEALIITVLLLFNALIAFVQEHRAQDALALLKNRLHVNARVLRDGQWQTMAAEAIVPDDIVHVRAGDIVPADFDVLDGQLSLDQAALTGESLPIDAAAGKVAYTGSVVLQGEATGKVSATGSQTYFGQTAELVRTSNPPSHMQRTIFAIVRWLMIIDAVLVAVVTAYAIAHHLPWIDTVLFILMLLVVSIPVALPATYTLATAIGSMQLAHEGVLVTRLPAIEDAAAMDTLVSDKTGTLTQNKLVLSAIHPLGDATEEDVLRAAALASNSATQDALDLVILNAAKERNVLHDLPPLEEFLPFDPSTRRSEGIYHVSDHRWQAIKGASTAIAPMCHLDVMAEDAMQQAERDLARQGARVLAIASGTENDLKLIGLVGLADPIRPDAPKLIRHLRMMGIRVRMATGDALETARVIGSHLGLGTHVCHIQGQEIHEVEDCDLFARVLPQEKHLIVKALQKTGHVTGMTGDGVNDAPALRQAELGIAVSTATDVAKAAAGVVLTENGLAGVIAVVSAGRDIHRRMLTYTLNKILRVLVVVVFLAAGVLLTGRFLLTSTLIVIMIFANDFATMSIATDRVRPSSKPQRWEVPQLMGSATCFAALSLLVSVAIYLWAASRGLNDAQLETVVFLILVFTNQTSLYVLRGDGPIWQIRPTLWMIFASVVDIIGVSLLAAFGVFMAAISCSTILGILAASAVLAMVLDFSKPFIFSAFSIA